MSDSQPVPLLGRLAVHNKLITLEQLTEALREAGRAGEDRKLGELLVDLGFLNQTQLQKLVVAQRKVLEAHRAKLVAASPQPPAPSLFDETPKAAPSAPPEPEGEPVVPAPKPEAAPAPELKPAVAAAPAAAQTEAPSPAPTAPGPKRARSQSAPAPGGAIDDLLRDAVQRGASDVHVHAQTPLRMRVAGELVQLEQPPGDTEALLYGALDAASREELEREGEIDFCYSLAGVGRFRANVYREQRGLDGVFRHIPPTPPTLESLGLPRSMAKLTTYNQGMVLVTGPTGCGKTSTLAALVDLINEERRDHILTIEDPIEYLHSSKRCLVNQRTVKHHTESFARALRAALREDPDIIVIGELRDLETISLALTAAETGHLVLATLHTDNTLRTLNRMVGAFPADQQDQVRTMLSESLRAVISQKLIPRADGAGRVPAIETLIVNKAVGNLIRDNKVFQIQSILQTGASQGMGLLDESIKTHVAEGTISVDVARRYVSDPKILAA
jgi:twitching motility protein PilT